MKDANEDVKLKNYEETKVAREALRKEINKE